MSTATAPAANVSRSEMEGKNASYHGSNSGFVQTQCSPMPQPALGFQRIIYGNGTSVGTVIALRCPDKHKLIGDSVKCVLDTNSTHWEGETYCKPLSYNETHGLHLAILISIVSLGIIFFMSMAFLTCCLVDCIEKNKRKEMERDSREMPPLWEEQNHQREMNRPRYSNKSRNNNNNNLMEKELTQWNHCDPGQQRDYHTCRCQQQYSYDPIGPYSHDVASRSPVLPGYENDQSFLPQNPNSCLQPIGSSRETSDLAQVDATRSDPVWQCGARQQGNLPGTLNQLRNKNPAKEFSIRVISV